MENQTTNERLGSDTLAQDNSNLQDNIRVLSASSCSAVELSPDFAEAVKTDDRRVIASLLDHFGEKRDWEFWRTRTDEELDELSKVTY